MDGISSFSWPMYCQMSSSVQLDSGKTLMCSPLRIRVAELVAEGEDPLLGPGLLLVPAATPEDGVELVFLDRVQQGGGLQPVTARPPAGLLDDPPLVDGLLD